MSLWRLPPVMIIHLKRFQFTQQMRRKLRDLVVFPIEGLDFSRIVAQTNPDAKIPPPAMNGSSETSLPSIDKGDEMKIKASNRNHVPHGGGDNDISTKLMNDMNGRWSSLYDLYGVVHHQGALSGGHYVASLRSDKDKSKWHLFNDAQIFEINSRDIVDPSAYILFYVRRDVKDSSLTDFWDTSGRESDGMTEEELEKMTKQKGCVIS